MKIAHIQLLPMMSGVQRVSFEELIRLDDSKYERVLICKEPGELTELCIEQGIRVEYISNLVREISPLKDISAFLKLFKLLKKEKFDIVHVHSAKTGFLGRIAARLAGVRAVIYTVHGYPFPAAKTQFAKKLYFFLEYIGSKFCDKTICLHENDANITINDLKVPKNKVQIIPNGVNTQLFQPSSKEKDKELKKVGMVGRLWEQKDPVTLVRASIELCKKRDDFEVSLIGGGEYYDQLLDEIEQAKLSNKIHLLGWKKDIPEQLKSFDIFVLPSKWEGMPLAILEAQSCALPCVVSNIPGNSDLVTDGFDGEKFEVGSVRELSEKLESLLDNPELAVKMGRNGRKKVLEHYDINRRIEVIELLYKESLKY